MSKYQNRQEVADKADWEGGLLDFIFGYGLHLDELPEGDVELRNAVADVLAVGPALERLKALLPEPDGE